jgi:hypothetical protein
VGNHKSLLWYLLSPSFQSQLKPNRADQPQDRIKYSHSPRGQSPHPQST